MASLLRSQLNSKVLSRGFSTTRTNAYKVCVVGGAGGIGQPLSMLMSLNPDVTEVRVFDMVGAPGVAADLSHIDTPAKVTGHGMNLKQFTGEDQIENQKEFQDKAFDEALNGADVVLIPAGVPRKPGMTRQDLFNVNASLVASFAEGVARNCPKALVGVICNPVNSTVPIFAETLKKLGCYDPNRIFGVTTLDVVRARTFIAEAAGVPVADIEIPVIGGHAGASILPLISRTTPEVKSKLSQDVIDALTDRIQNGGTEVVMAKAGAGSATLSMAKAGAEFGNALIDGLKGKSNVVACAYVESDVHPECQWFATPVELGPNGMTKNLGIGEMDDYEKELLDKAVAELKPSIEEGKTFVASN